MNLTRRGGMAGLGACAIGIGLRAVNGAEAAEQTSFKFQFDGRRPTVDVTLDGRPFRFLIDTGADRLALPAATASAIGLKTGYQLHAAGLGGGDGVPLYRVNELVVGGAVRRSAETLIALPALYLPRGIDGILPVLNLGPGVMRFSDQTYEVMETPAQPPTDIPVRSAISHASHDRFWEKLILPVDLDGRRLHLAIDTGAPGAVTLVGHSALAHELWGKPESGPMTTAFGATGPIQAKVFRGRRLEVAGFGVDQPNVTISDPAAPSDPALAAFDGLLGIEVLQRFDLWLDVAHMRYGLRPNGLTPPLSGMAEREVFL